MHADPITHADQHEVAVFNRTTAYHAELRSVEAEIREGFTAHFNGKPGATVPTLVFVGGHDQVVTQAAREAVSDALDYDDTDAAMHSMLCGQLPLENMRELLIARYIQNNADDIVWARTGLSLPRKSYSGPDLSMLTILRGAA